MAGEPSFTDFLGGAGVALGGVGGLIGAFSAPDAPPTINPEVAAALQARVGDINEFLANVQAQAQAQNIPFNQALQKYTALLSPALQEAYDTLYGQGEREQAQYAQDALSGRPTAPTTQMIANVGQLYGQQGNALAGNIRQNLAQGGMDLTSPYAQSALQKGETDIAKGFGQTAGNIYATQGNQDIANALAIIARAQSSGRIAGANLPQVPQTAEEKEMAARKAGQDAYDAAMEKAKGNPLGAVYGGAAATQAARQAYQAAGGNPNYGVAAGGVTHPGSYNLPVWMSGGSGGGSSGPSWMQTQGGGTTGGGSVVSGGTANPYGLRSGVAVPATYSESFYTNPANWNPYMQNEQAMLTGYNKYLANNPSAFHKTADSVLAGNAQNYRYRAPGAIISGENPNMVPDEVRQWWASAAAKPYKTGAVYGG